MSIDLGLRILRLVVGLMMAAHGAQKLFGWFGGRGLAGQVTMLERLDIQPARLWAPISALGESLGGLGLAGGLLTPLAAAAVAGSMLVAMAKVHWRNGLWNTNGGIEFPLVLTAAAISIGLAGPGRISLDAALGLRLPEPATSVVALAAMILTVLAALRTPGRTRGIPSGRSLSGAPR